MVTERPEQVCGIHFFNPAPAMKLVEVIRPITASDETIAAAIEFATACGKDAVEVTDRAGFIVNALLFPYLNNAVRMWEQGTASMESIDTAMKGGCNFPMGPFALLDLVGLDTSLAILDALYAEFRDPNYAAVPTLRRNGRRRPPRPQDQARLLHVLSPDAACRAAPGAHAASMASGGGPGGDVPTVRDGRSDLVSPDRAAADPLAAAAPRHAPTSTVCAASAPTSQPGTLLAAYRIGLFPMPLRKKIVGWWSPDPRGVLPLDGLRVTRSLRQSMKRYEVRIDTRFREVMERCGDPTRPHGWITPAFVDAYERLFELGWAHSVETYLGRTSWSAACTACGSTGCSPASRCSPSSATRRRWRWSRSSSTSRETGATLLDVQWKTDHLASLGAVEVSRAQYLADLRRRRRTGRSPADSRWLAWSDRTDRTGVVPVVPPTTDTERPGRSGPCGLDRWVRSLEPDVVRRTLPPEEPPCVPFVRPCHRCAESIGHAAATDLSGS